MRSIAETGIALRSTPVEPRPMLPLRCTSALVCRRLPLMRTSTWSGPRPRRVAGRTESVPSVMVGRGKLKDGASFWMTCMVSLRPVASICRAVMMSTGTAFSASAPTAREPDGDLLVEAEAEGEVVGHAAGAAGSASRAG